MRIPLLLIAIFALSSLVGCVDRVEHLKIKPDGSVAVRLQLRADHPDELIQRSPCASSWRISSDEIHKDDGETDYILDANRDFAPGVSLPSNYSNCGDGDEVSLQSPTTVTVETRDDAVYYHWRRVYTKRPWAYIDGVEQQLKQELRDQTGLDLEDVNFEQLTPQQRRAVLHMFVKLEAAKAEVFARRAFDDIAPDEPPDAWLRMREAIIGAYDVVNVEKLEQLLGMPDTDHRASLLQEEATRIETNVVAELTSAARQWRDDDLAIQSLQRRFRHHEQYYEHTWALGGDKLAIHVTLPGEIVASNAAETEDGVLIWRLSGTDVRDRSVELMATSRLSKEPVE